MARRSSARLRDRNSTTPKRVSLSHDAGLRTPRTVPAKLSSLQESDEMPGAFPRSASPDGRGSPRFTKRRAVGPDATPRQVTSIKPTDEEMHPQQHQQTTAKPLDEARHLGFYNMSPHTEPPKHTSRIATLQGTPTKARNPGEDIQSPTYAFTFRREHSLELSPDAKRLMNEKREEAARIREQMISSAESSRDASEAAARKIATPKGKKGRFSGAHMAQFEKMDSIAGHASAFRSRANDVIATGPSHVVDSNAQAGQKKSLKRSPSKAQLDDANPQSHKTLHRSPSKPTLTAAGSHLPRATSTIDLNQSTSPAKRNKRAETDAVSATRPHSSDDAKSLPATPGRAEAPRMHPSNPHMSTLTTPTQSSLARGTSVTSLKTSMIPGPLLKRSPSKPSLVDTKSQGQQSSGPLLARSPSKASLFASAQPPVEQTTGPSSPLLSRSPSKAFLFSKVPTQAGQTAGPATAFLACSPHKAPSFKNNADVGDGHGSETREALLLARAPLKVSVAKSTAQEPEGEKASAIPLLAKSPSKISLMVDSKDSGPQAPGKANNSLMGRFNLLRSSPMKSILRTPQRLYSNDPSKVAAGTHLATPPKFSRGDAATLPPKPPSTAPVSKRVDFSSSTKARDEATHSDESRTPSKEPSPPSQSVEKSKSTSNAAAVDYPALPDAMSVSPSPQKRRQTIAPGDFTFRAGEHGIVFGTSPNAHPSVAKLKRPSTIRHVSADACGPAAPAAGSKKRKFEFENEVATHPETVVHDKENAGDGVNATDVDEERPAKRTKANPPAQTSPVKTIAPATRVPTLGVKPKKGTQDGKDKRPTTISQARLNALAQPKRRF